MLTSGQQSSLAQSIFTLVICVISWPLVALKRLALCLLPVPAPPPRPPRLPPVTFLNPPSPLLERLMVSADVGVSVTQGILIAAGVPLFALLVCCCAGYVIAKKKEKVGEGREERREGEGRVMRDLEYWIIPTSSVFIVDTVFATVFYFLSLYSPHETSTTAKTTMSK